MIYLASPYSDPNPAVEERRYHEALSCLTHYTAAGLVMFSPIVHNHHMAKLLQTVYAKPNPGWGFWRKIDIEFLRRSTCLWILGLQGWSNSVGCKEEWALACDLNLQREFINPVSIAEGRYRSQQISSDTELFR